MSSVQHLGEFICARLTAAAAEIFAELQRTIVRYEEEVVRQQRLLETRWRPHLHLEPADLPQHHSHEEEVALTGQELWNQNRSSTVDQEEPPQIKEEQEEILISPAEQLALKEATESLMIAVTQDNRDHREPEPSRDQLLFQNPPLDVSPGCEGSNREDSESAADGESGAESKHDRNRRTTDEGHSRTVENSGMSESLGETDEAKTSLTCDVCGKAFRYRSHIMRHRRTHTGEKPFLCPICGKRFSSDDSLLVHIRTHTGQKPYSCQICGKSFTQQSSLISHTRVDTGEKPFTCDTCGKRLALSCKLRVHSRTHTGEKPYTCDTCGKCISQSGNLVTHKTVHTGEKPHSCST